MKRLSSHSSWRAFTLLEVLVAVAVMSLFMLIASQVVSSSLSQWTYANAKMTIGLQARLAFEWIERDLQTIMLSDDEDEWLRIKPISVTGRGGQTVISSRIMCYAQPGEPRQNPVGSSFISGPMAVSYAVDYRDPMVMNGARKRFALFRNTVNPRDTFENMGVANLSTEFWDVIAGSPDQSNRPFVPANIIADNVVGFRVVAEYRNETGILLRSRPGETFAFGQGGMVSRGSDTPVRADLEAFEVTFWILDAQAADRATAASGTGLLDKAVTFTKRIPLSTR